MTYNGHVQNGVIILDDGAQLPEGARVRVEPVDGAAPKKKTLADRLGNLIGIVDDLPADMAEQHDHYIHGTPKNP